MVLIIMMLKNLNYWSSLNGGSFYFFFESFTAPIVEELIGWVMPGRGGSALTA